MEYELRRHIADRALTARLESRPGPELVGRLRFLDRLEPLLHAGMTVSQARTQIRVAVGDCIMERLDWAYVSGVSRESQALDAWIGLLNHRSPMLAITTLDALAA